MLRTFLLAVIVPLLLGADAPVTLKLSSPSPERSPWGKGLVDVAAAVQKQTDGRVRIKLYPGGIQGDERTVLRKLRVDQLQGAAFLNTGMTQICPDSSALKLPLLFRTEAEVDFLLSRMADDFDAQARGNGFRLMGFPHLGFSSLYSSKRVATIEDLQASRPWLVEDDPLVREFYSVLKVTPESLGLPDVLPALQSGLIGGVFAPPAGLIALQWHPHVRFQLDLAINYGVGIVVISDQGWQRVAEGDREIVRRCFADGIAQMNRAVAQQNADSLAVIRESGIALVSITAESLTRLQAATAEVTKKFTGDLYRPEVLLRIESLLSEFRSREGQKP
ncbi:MAG: TRAP transporter substrate-binding protein DctP [Planctomycetota bacterium]